MRRLVGVVGVFCFTISAHGAGLSLNALRSQLKRVHSTWVAGPTKISVLPPEEQRYFLGNNIPLEEDYFFTPLTEVSEWGPAAHDWRDIGGVRYSSPVLDQGRCGSCVAFAAIGQLETQMNIIQKAPSSPWAFSTQHLFSCGGGSCNSGWGLGSAVRYLKGTGVPDSACFPYESGALGKDVSCRRTCSDASSRSLKIITYSRPSGSVESLKKALAKGPLMASMTVYEDFTFYKSGVYRHTKGKVRGGHAVSIEGWNDEDKAWIVKNSWGVDWGEKGYFRIAWGDRSGIERGTFGIEVAEKEGYVSMPEIRDRMVLSGTANFSIASTYADTSKMAWAVSQNASVVAEGEVARISNVSLDTTELKDGAYQIQATVESAKGTKQSQIREVFVLNGKLTGSLDFKNVKDGDTFKGKKILELEISSTPILFTELIFRAKNVATGKEIIRRSPNVASRVNLSFNSPNTPNGDYDVVLEGVAGAQKVTSRTVRIKIAN